VTDEELITLFEELFGDDHWPRAVRLLEAVARVRRGESVASAAAAVGTTPRRLEQILDEPRPGVASLGAGPEDITEEHRQRAQKILGQMLLGRCAEMVFESRYRTELDTEELELKDTREGGTDTDYRLYNGQGRPVARINIKFHGAQFRRAAELVGLEPGDCFALATYKIQSALEKHISEGLPYFFAIVGVPNLTAAAVGKRFPPEMVDALAIILAAGAPHQRPLEDALIEAAVRETVPVFKETYDQIAAADWYVLSAKRAHKLLMDKLYDRVFALRVKSFTRAFQGAEVDMHFSLSGDLTPLGKFFKVLKEGLAKLSTLIERGEL
jgi:hypothetical protein